VQEAFEFTMTVRGSRWPAIWLALRSIAWAVLLPGLVAGYLPWRFFGLAHVQLSLRNPVHPLGVLCIGRRATEEGS
jgi:hypothetical protein